jgi:hypothetical protein
MDGKHFDSLTRSLSGFRTRRGAFSAFLGGTLGLLGHSGGAAKKKGKGGKGKKKKKAPALPPATPCIPNCASKVCGDDGCGGRCGVECTEGKTCQGGACICPPGRSVCPTTGFCSECCTNSDCCNSQNPCPNGEVCQPAANNNMVCACTDSNDDFCNGACLSPGTFLTDPNNCGGCGRQCPPENPACNFGSCGP